MTRTAADRMTVVSLSPPSVPRLRVEPTRSRHTLLDGGWWPRSTNPVAELPGLVLAIDGLRGPISRLVLSADGWDSHPRRLGVAGRVLRLDYFASQPAALLTAICGNGDRVDLLIVAPGTATNDADAAMVLAASTGNLIHVQHLLAAPRTPPRGGPGVGPAEQRWEDEGGRELVGQRMAPPPVDPTAGAVDVARRTPYQMDVVRTPGS